MRILADRNSLGCELPSGLDVNQLPNAQDAFQPILGLFSCAGATGSVDVTCRVHVTQMAGLSFS